MFYTGSLINTTILELMDEKVLEKKYITQLPCQIYPSDHLPIMTEFSFCWYFFLFNSKYLLLLFICSTLLKKVPD